MVSTEEALAASFIGSALITGTYFAAEQSVFAGDPVALGGVVFTASFLFSYAGMMDWLPF